MTKQMHALGFGALSVAVVFARCGGDPAVSDRCVENKGAEAFLHQIAGNCGSLSVGSQTLGYLLGVHTGDAYCIDVCSKLYFGKTDRALARLTFSSVWHNIIGGNQHDS